MPRTVPRCSAVHGRIGKISCQLVIKLHQQQFFLDWSIAIGPWLEMYRYVRPELGSEAVAESDLSAGWERRALASSLEEALEKPPMEPRVQAEISRTKVAPPAPTPTRNCTQHLSIGNNTAPWVGYNRTTQPVMSGWEELSSTQAQQKIQ